MQIPYTQCCFFGWGRVVPSETLMDKLRELLEKLITKHNIKYFNFGSRSDFDDIAHAVVTRLKARYRQIERVGYPLNREMPVIASLKEETERALRILDERFLAVKDFDHLINFRPPLPNNGTANELRNRRMIDNSQICIFFCQDREATSQDMFETRRQNKRDYDQAMRYARIMNKQIIMVQG